MLYGYMKMPNDKNCNRCGAGLSPQRHKTYHQLVNGVDKEVCKKCYGNKR